MFANSLCIILSLHCCFNLFTLHSMLAIAHILMTSYSSTKKSCDAPLYSKTLFIWLYSLMGIEIQYLLYTGDHCLFENLSYIYL